jgi:hypothetical protein
VLASLATTSGLSPCPPPVGRLIIGGRGGGGSVARVRTNSSLFSRARHADCAGNYITPVGATQSSFYNEANYPASNGITNDTGFIHSGSGAAQWYQVDLGATFAVGRVTVDNRAHCCQQRIGELFPTPTWNLPSLVHAHATALLHTSPSRHMLRDMRSQTKRLSLRAFASPPQAASMCVCSANCVLSAMSSIMSPTHTRIDSPVQ